MYDKIIIQNTTIDEQIIVARPSGEFLLDDNNSIDWGEVDADISTFNALSLIGAGLQNVSISQGRYITIIGYVINDYTGTIKEKKKKLNMFTNPFDKILVKIDDKFFIEGLFSSAVKYSNTNSENNDILCKFQLSIFCPNPCFKLIDSDSTLIDFEVYQKLFTLPIEWVSGEKIVMGIQKSYDEFTVNNPGTLDIGFKMIIDFITDVENLRIKNADTNQEFRLSSSVTMEKGDQLIINSESGNKSITVKYYDSESEQPAIGLMDLSSDFLNLKQGKNRLQFYGSSNTLNSSNIDVHFKINPLYLAMEGQ